MSLSLGLGLGLTMQRSAGGSSRALSALNGNFNGWVFDATDNSFVSDSSDPAEVALNKNRGWVFDADSNDFMERI